MKNILIIGSGGREHVLTWKLHQSNRVDKIFVLPGNAGTAQLAENVDIDVMDFKKIVEFIKTNKVDMTFVGPEKPLANGIVDYLTEKNIEVFGPNKRAAKLEGSKVYAKKIMKECNIPTAEFETFKDPKKAYDYLDNSTYPLVVKAEGLAYGKGVIIADNKSEAKKAVKKIMEDKYFGKAGEKIVIEEYLKGEEVSIMVFSDGNTYYQMVSAQDHKKIGENDTGLNTGGMGAYAPTPLISENLKTRVDQEVLKPLFNYLKSNDITFKGILFLGLMIEKKAPKVLEFNVRFGDPEAQVVLPLLENDLLTIAEKINQGKLDQIELEWKNKKSMAVIMASGGYPVEYKKGKEIYGLNDIKDPDCVVFHAGTKLHEKKVYTDGGRVLAVTSLGDSYQEVYDKCYQNIKMINFDKAYYRKDIGHKIKGVKLLNE
ncbi:MAG: phosphoribosylamine--glycine ligase [Bacillota bacterium]